MSADKQKHISLCCISHAFHQSASTNPTKLAIIQHSKLDHDGDKFFTFSQLSSAVDSLSSKLHHIINGGDDPSLIKPTSANHKLNGKTKLVGVYMVPSVEYVITVLSILRCGAAFLPLDPFWPKERILKVISSSNVGLIVGCLNYGGKKSAHVVDKSHWLVNCCKIAVSCISVDGLFEQKCGELELVWPCESGGLREFCYLMYTSGSTGEPKGVCGTEEGILNRFLWMQELYPLSEDDVLLFKTSVSFVDHLQEFLAPVIAGCTFVVPPVDVLKGNLFGMVDFLHDYCVTRMVAVPSLMRVLVPALEGRYSEGVECSLRLLVLSGEVFAVSLWKVLCRVLPKTCILNIYGSTEVSGDCMFFDCKRLAEMLENEMLSSVPIGEPISNCDLKLIEDDGKRDEGEICVRGVCVSSGYYSEGNIMPWDRVRVRDESVSADGHPSGNLYYRTGDFARRLPGGDLVFLGRKDRTIKVNGQRIALEEIEDVLRGHPSIADAAVAFCNEREEHAFLGAVLVLKHKTELSEILGSIKIWMVDRLPSVMVPKDIVCTETIPLSSTGKVDYTLLSSFFSQIRGPNDKHINGSKTLEHIREAFYNALDVAEVGSDDDFFVLGGDSIMAAHVAHILGIDMRLMYMFPSPSKLQKALMEKDGLEVHDQIKWETLPDTQKEDLLHSSDTRNTGFLRSRKRGEKFSPHSDEHGTSKHLKVGTDFCSYLTGVTSISLFPWDSRLVPTECSLGRCNKVMYNNNFGFKDLRPEISEVELPKNSIGSLRKIWGVPMDSCVDASPLVAFKNGEMLIFVGSHSHKFLCVNGRNGVVRWEMKLEGRIECSAVVDGDFSQVVVGCYQGNIYFIDMLKGIINWTFLTGGEVKSQPTVDRCRHLIWCGSHDHTLYGLNYRNHCCVHQFPCNGSIFGSPAIDEALEILYVGTTNGRLTAISLKASAFSQLWLLELEAPVFGSLSISYNGNVICCLVSGGVVCVNPKGSVVWRVTTDGPIFAGPCISKALGSQALVCSRNGRIYSFELESGGILWEYNVGDPITASAYVDDNIQLISDPSFPSERLVCICSSSGKVILLRVSCIVDGGSRLMNMHKKFAEIVLPGDIFSSPVMVGGKIFVGCRDDYLHCLESYLETD